MDAHWDEWMDSSPHQYAKNSQFVGAGIVAFVFKVAAMLVVVAGVLVVQHIHQVTGASYLGRAQLAVEGATVRLAASFAFFAYVLDMLRALVLDGREGKASVQETVRTASGRE